MRIIGSLQRRPRDLVGSLCAISQRVTDRNEGGPVEAVILPIAPHAAVIPGTWIYYSKAAFCSFPQGQPLAYELQDYGTIANTMDYTTIIIPVTRADKTVDKFDDKYEPLNDVDERNWKACRFPLP